MRTFKEFAGLLWVSIQYAIFVLKYQTCKLIKRILTILLTAFSVSLFLALFINAMYFAVAIFLIVIAILYILYKKI
jgi:hypothetical protein